VIGGDESCTILVEDRWNSRLRDVRMAVAKIAAATPPSRADRTPER